jgi:hypothetical protein
MSQFRSGCDFPSIEVDSESDVALVGKFDACSFIQSFRPHPS